MGRHNFKKMKIWQQGIDLVQKTYEVVRTFPEIEKYNLVTQLIRCAVSIPSNIAEGTSKKTDKHFSQFLDTSLGSAFEWETQMIVAHNQGYIDEKQFHELEKKIQDLQKMIYGFMDGLKRKS